MVSQQQMQQLASTVQAAAGGDKQWRSSKSSR